MSETIVAVVAHPDDESLIAGGTLVLAGGAGATTGVVSLTRGEHGPVAGAPLRASESLGSVRETELKTATAELGVSWTRCLDHPDGGLEWTDHRAVARDIAELLIPLRPTSLLTFGEDGLYWHPDHIATRAIVGLAGDLLERAHAEPLWLYEAAWRPELVTQLVIAARRRGLPSDMWGLDPNAFGSSEGGSMVAVDVRPVLDRKLAALRAHRTQLGPGHLLTALPEDLARQFLGEETWRVSRPVDAGPGPLGVLAVGGRYAGSDGRR